MATVSKSLQQIDFYTFLDVLGLIEKKLKRFGKDDVITQLKSGQDKIVLAGFNPMVVALYNGRLTSMSDIFSPAEESIFKNRINTLSANDWRDLRFTVGLYMNGSHASENFYKSKVIARLDTDKKMELEEFIGKLDYVFQGYLPNIIHRTYKGWHAFWLTDDFIENKDRHLIENFVALLNKKKVEKEAVWIDKLDGIGAMTRIIDNDDLPCYVFNQAIYPVEKLKELKTEEIKTDYDYIIPSLTEFEDVLSQCGAYQTLDNIWETHNHDQWFTMTWLYAVRYYLNDSIHKKTEIYNNFINNALRWPNASEKENKKKFTDALKWAITEDKIKLPSCRSLYIEGICEKCPVFRMKDNEIVSHPFRDAYKFNHSINGFEIINGRWFEVENDGEEKRYSEICKEFKITKVFRKYMPSETMDYLNIVFNNKHYVVAKENKADGGLNLSTIANIIPIKDKKRFRRLIEQYVYNLVSRRKNFIEIDFVGYRKKHGINNYEYIVANENVSEQDLYGILYGYFQGYNTLADFIPVKRGKHEDWKEAYLKLFDLREPLALYLIAFALSHLLLDWYREKVGYVLTPIVAIKGESRTGKTKRSLFALALYGKPKEFNFGSITEARIKNQFGVIRTPIVIDEVVSRGSNFEKMRNLLYHIANASIKADAYKTAPPIVSPVIMTGEPKNFKLEKIFEEAQGLIRRVFTILIKREKISEEVWKTIDEEILPKLSKNHGWIFKHIQAFKLADKERIFKKMKDYVSIKFEKFKDTLYEEHITQIALSFTAFKIFYLDLGKNEEEIKQVIGLISDYLLEKAEIMVEFITSDNTFEDLILDIANKIKEAEANKKDFSGLSLSQAFAKANVSIAGLNKEESLLLRLIFGKRYKSRHYYYVNNVLVDSIYKEEDANRLLQNKELVDSKTWQEFTDVYKSVILRKYGTKDAENILKYFSNQGLKEFEIQIKEENIEEIDI
jgi:hypothetical protein